MKTFFTLMLFVLDSKFLSSNISCQVFFSNLSKIVLGLSCLSLFSKGSDKQWFSVLITAVLFVSRSRSCSLYVV